MAQQEATIPQMQALTEAVKDTTLLEVAHDAGGGNFVSRRASAAQIAAHAAAALAGRTTIERAFRATDLVQVALGQGSGQFAARKATVRDLADFAAVDGAGRFVPFLSDLSRPPNEMAGLVGYTLTGMPGVTSLQFDRLVTCPGGITVADCAELLGLEFPVLERAARLAFGGCRVLPAFTAPRLQALDDGGEIWIGNNPTLLIAEFPALSDGGQDGCSITFYSNTKLTRVSAPLLSKATVDVQVHPALVALELTALSEGSVKLDAAAIRELSLPAFAVGSLNLSDLQQLEALSVPLLAEGDINLSGPTQLASLDLPELTTLDWGLFCQDNASLANVSLPKLANAGSSIVFSGCALSGQSVNHILAKLVADPTFGNDPERGPKSADLSGGTNAAPTGQGLVDKATLIARGANITTN
jgi:hypothetical protein